MNEAIISGTIIDSDFESGTNEILNYNCNTAEGNENSFFCIRSLHPTNMTKL